MGRGRDQHTTELKNVKRKSKAVSSSHGRIPSLSEAKMVVNDADCTSLSQIKSVATEINGGFKSAALFSKGRLQSLAGEIVEDVYEDSRLRLYHPLIPRNMQNLSLYVMPMASVSEDIRSGVEHILHVAWKHDKRCTENISRLLGLETFMNLRSGRRMTRPSCSLEVSVDDLWLIWEVSKVDHVENPIVGALVLRRQAGGLVIEYLTALRTHGGKGFPMVQAAEVICEKEGFAVLWSAVDLSQDGQKSVGTVSAAEAHKRWCFQPSTAQEWQEMGLDLYDETECSVRYMKKELQPMKRSTNKGRPLSLIEGVQVIKVRGQWVAAPAKQTKTQSPTTPKKK